MMTMGERMGEGEIDEIVGDSELVNNDYIAIEDFAKMIMNRIWNIKDRTQVSNNPFISINTN